MTQTDKQTAAIGWMARAGYASRGLVFLIIGMLAILAAAGSGSRTVGAQGALYALLRQPFGQALLGIVAVGLLCFALWRLLQAIVDADHCGKDVKGLLRRAGFAGSALIHLALAGAAAGLALGFARSARSEDQTVRDWTVWLMMQPLGRWMTMAIGLAVVGFGIALAVKALRADFRDDLGVTAATREWIVRLGRIGYVARGLMFLLIGGMLLIAAWYANASEAQGFGGALRAVERQPYGWILLGLVAAGLLSYAGFEFAQAAYRRVDSPNVREAAEKVGAKAAA